jgi:hypothetical protein
MSGRAIEAIAAVIRDLGHDPKADAGRAWAAGVEAAIAHAPCGGTNIGAQTSPGEARFDTDDHDHDWRDGNNIIGGPFLECLCGATADSCPGSHTVIDKGDGTKLYADTHLVGTYMGREKMVLVPSPSKWRIE